jgi:SulP family sulfate permease
LALVLGAWVPGFSVVTIGSRFGPVSGLPPFAFPWATMDGGMSWQALRDLMPSAFAIAMLGALESLLCAVVADGMTGERHDPDAELVGQGIANLVAPFFGGFAATAAMARTATNIRAGARSPLASVLHAIILLGALAALAPVLGTLPLAALAAMLIIVAWHMSDFHHVVRVVRRSPKSDVVVMVTCFLLTVLVDMVVAVGVGFVLASFLFMRRMIETTEVRMMSEGRDGGGLGLPEGVAHYEIAGPMFFGASRKAMETLEAVAGRGIQTVLLDLEAVNSIDATALINLESAIDVLGRHGTRVVIAGLRPQVRRALGKAQLGGEVVTYETMAQAVAALGGRPRAHGSDDVDA